MPRLERRRRGARALSATQQFVAAPVTPTEHAAWRDKPAATGVSRTCSGGARAPEGNGR